MEIPESISSLMTEVPADSFLAVKKVDLLSIDQIVHELKRGLEFKDLQSFDQGYSFYKKDISTDKIFIKNLLSLLLDHTIKSVRTSTIADTAKDEVISSITLSFKSIEQIVETNINFLNILNKEQNILDAKALMMIILGYAISVTKRIHSN